MENPQGAAGMDRVPSACRGQGDIDWLALLSWASRRHWRGVHRDAAAGASLGACWFLRDRGSQDRHPKS